VYRKYGTRQTFSFPGCSAHSDRRYTCMLPSHKPPHSPHLSSWNLFLPVQFYDDVQEVTRSTEQIVIGTWNFVLCLPYILKRKKGNSQQRHKAETFQEQKSTWIMYHKLRTDMLMRGSGQYFITLFHWCISRFMLWKKLLSCPS
jgi:hypothetical protein